MERCSGGATSLRHCWPRSSAGLCGWLADRRLTVELRQTSLDRRWKPSDDQLSRLVPISRKEQQRRADDERSQRNVELHGFKLLEQLGQSIKDIGQGRDQ